MIESVEREMAPRGNALARRHLICASCSSWIQFDSSGCTNSWADMRGRGAFVFTCKGCTEVTRLVGEVGYLRQMMESTNRMITRQGLEEERGVTGIQVARLEETEEEEEKCERVMTPGNSSTEENRNGKETAERSSSEDRGTLIEIEGEHITDGEETDREETDRQLLLDGKGIRPGTQMLATHIYKKNPDGPVENELDLSEGETLVYLMKHDDNDHWWLAENGKGQVGYVPAAYLMIIVDETLQEEDSDTTRKEGQGRGTDGTKIGGEMWQDGERRKTYSAAVIDGFKRNFAIYVGDSIVRKTDTRLSNGKDVVVCLSGARIEHVTERIEKIMGRGMEGPYWYTSGRTTQTRKEQQQ